MFVAILIGLVIFGIVEPTRGGSGSTTHPDIVDDKPSHDHTADNHAPPSSEHDH